MDLDFDAMENKPKKKKGKGGFTNPFASTSASDAVKATGNKSVTASGLKRVGIYVPPEMEAAIDLAGKEAGYKKSEFWRWLIEQAYQQYEAGKIAPHAQKVERKTIALKKWGR